MVIIQVWILDQMKRCIEQDERGKDGAGNKIESIPPKIVAMDRVRRNMNRGS